MGEEEHGAPEVPFWGWPQLFPLPLPLLWGWPQLFPLPVPLPWYETAGAVIEAMSTASRGPRGAIIAQPCAPGQAWRRRLQSHLDL